MTGAVDISVTCRHGVYPGVRLGRVASYDFEIPSEHEVADPTNRVQRAFLLLDDHIQLQQPLTFLGAYAGWWYVDLVSITENGPAITVVDQLRGELGVEPRTDWADFPPNALDPLLAEGLT